MISRFLPIFATIFIVIDPIGLVPLYIGLTAHIPGERKKQIIAKAVFISFVVLAVFIVLGKWILAVLGIQTGAFYIAGGIMLFIVSLEMLFGRPTQSKVSNRETPPEDDAGIAVFPLAIPMLAGPGAITAIILFTGSGDHLTMMAMLFSAISMTLAAVWIILSASNFILGALGKTGVSVIERIVGILLSGLSIQFVYDGVIKLGFLPPV
ncbi:MAG: MarC family protein [Spirochaetales bacterium]|jgi:multiple antibiotic resistance protein|nr:MarC family protein [Spirochaetales bacterium]